MDTDATRTLIEELLEAYNAPDLDRAALLYAEDCRYVNRSLGIRIEGREAQRANMQAFLGRFPDRKIRPRRVIAEEGGAAVEVEFVATSPGGPRMPQAGQLYSVEMCCVFELRDGLVASEHDYIDRPPTWA
jgi:steroid delta-isomerase-like uncharacterized protein